MPMASQPSDPITPLKPTARMNPTDPSPETTRSTPRNPNLPISNSPYARAKHVQMIDKDPNKAVPLFWAAINRGDRVDSALKDMALVMKQLNRAEEAIEAVRSFRGLCSFDAQEPLDNVLLDLYKKCGMIEEQIELMNFKLKMIDEGLAFGGRSTKLAKSQGIKHQVTINQERAKLLGNLAWAYMQAQRYKEAEPIYWQALDIEPDYNKQCNLAICLMQTGRFAEAKTLLRVVPYPSTNCNAECYIKSFERAWEMLKEFESQPAPSDERKEDTVHRITNPPFINPSLSNDTLSPSPPIYFSPQSDLKRRRSICEFRPPLSVNHNRRYMNGDRGGQNNKTVKVKEYSVEAHKLKPSTSPELSVDGGRSERAARNHELRTPDISAKARDKQTGGSYGSWKSPLDSDNRSVAITGSLQPVLEPPGSRRANVVEEGEKFQKRSVVNSDQVETPTTSCCNLESSEYLPVQDDNQTPLDISKGKKSEGLLTVSEKNANKENTERRAWGRKIEAEEEQHKKHPRIQSQGSFDGLDRHIQNENQLPSLGLQPATLKGIVSNRKMSALSQGCDGGKVMTVTVDKYGCEGGFNENDILKKDAKAKERFCTPSAIPKGRRTWADIAEEEEQEEELANNESDNSGDENVGLDIPHSNHHDLKSQDFTKKFSQKLDLVDQKKSEGSKTPRTGASSARRALSFIELSPGGNGMYSKQSLKMRYRMQVLKDITLDSNSEV